MSFALLPSLVALGATSCGGGDAPDPTTEPVGESKDAVNNGVPAPNTSFSHVVALAEPQGGWVTVPPTPICSATLITPVWVLTARHCIDGDPFTAQDTIDVFAGEFASVGPFRHANMGGPSAILGHGDVKFMSPPPTYSSVNDGIVSHDLALIRLDKVVPRDAAKPMRPPTTENACGGGNPFEGIQVGYGGGEDAGDNETMVIDCATVDGVRLRSAAPSDWSRRDHLNGGALFFTDEHVHALNYCGTYGGQTGGDSGGLLARTSDGMICGVISGRYPSPALAPPILDPLQQGVRMVNAAVDSQMAIDFILSNITDANGNIDGECPAALAGRETLDSDDDTIIEDCDNCPSAFNPLQSDADGDGVGNVCDPCFGANTDTDEDGSPDCVDPCIFDASLPGGNDLGDEDKDGLCRSEDNCPGAANVNQENTNELSELVHTPTKIWGDACDPVPTPRTEALVTRSTPLALSGFNEVKHHEVRDRIDVDPQPSRRAPEGPSTVAGAIVPAVPTHFRYCQPSAKYNVNCSDDADIQDEHLDIAPDQASESPFHPYHRVTMSFAPGSPGTPIPYTYGGSSTPHTSLWLYETDAQAWKTSGVVEIPDPEPDAGPYSGLNGWFWVHAETDVGRTQDVGTGLHGPELANTHFPLDPEYVVTTEYPMPMAYSPLKTRGPFFAWRWKPYPLPENWVTLHRPGDDMTLVPIADWVGPGSRARLAAIRPDGRLEPVPAGPGLVDSVLDPTRLWANAIEPSFAVGAADAPVAIALNADRTAIVDTATRGPDGRLLGILDRGESIVLPMAPPPPSVGSALVYSRFFRAAFLVGGMNGMSMDAPIGIWRTEVGSAHWFKTHFEPWPNIVAATVSFADRALYTIEERELVRATPNLPTMPDPVDQVLGPVSDGTSASITVARVMRYDLITGKAEALGPASGVASIEAATDTSATDPLIVRKKLYDTIDLTLDQQGNLLVVASSRDHQSHATARIRLDGEQPEVGLVESGPLPLAFPPLVDANGYEFYGVTPEGAFQVTRMRELNDPGVPPVVVDPPSTAPVMEEVENRVQYLQELVRYLLATVNDIAPPPDSVLGQVESGLVSVQEQLDRILYDIRYEEPVSLEQRLSDLAAFIDLLQQEVNRAPALLDSTLPDSQLARVPTEELDRRLAMLDILVTDLVTTVRAASETDVQVLDAWRVVDLLLREHVVSDGQWQIAHVEYAWAVLDDYFVAVGQHPLRAASGNWAALEALL